jgi:hypothetical protein
MQAREDEECSKASRLKKVVVARWTMSCFKTARAERKREAAKEKKRSQFEREYVGRRNDASSL